MSFDSIIGIIAIVCYIVAFIVIPRISKKDADNSTVYKHDVIIKMPTENETLLNKDCVVSNDNIVSVSTPKTTTIDNSIDDLSYNECIIILESYVKACDIIKKCANETNLPQYNAMVNIRPDIEYAWQAMPKTLNNECISGIVWDAIKNTVPSEYINKGNMYDAVIELASKYDVGRGLYDWGAKVEKIKEKFNYIDT